MLTLLWLFYKDILFDFSDCQALPTTEQLTTRPELLERSEYSYFSQAAVEAWAGPQHWKLRPRSKPQGLLADHWMR